MKKLFLLTTIAFIGIVACAQPSHPSSPHDTLTAKNLKVTYGRPYKKGRAIFGSLEPYGKVYRCGADENTTITFAKDATFGGKPVKAGTYSLFVIPNETKWTIILNSNPKQWGAFDYEKNKDKDVLHVDVPVKKLGSVVEQLTIKAPASDLIIEWDQTQVSVPFSFS
ncbi:MAG TPA: DUF2911 domain-containing protein [Puia sp.]|nr:DUF2911 domain-containing protein [Puia sp.]